MVKKIYFLLSIILVAVCGVTYASVVAFAEEGNTLAEYVESIDCEHCKISVEGDPSTDPLIEITLSDYETGYALDYVLVSCDGKTVITERDGNTITFLCPEQKFSIKVAFTQSVTEEPSDAPVLETKEIIAICIAGAAVIAGITTIIVRNKRRSS